jgi:hypothetical protein
MLHQNYFEFNFLREILPSTSVTNFRVHTPSPDALHVQSTKPYTYIYTWSDDRVYAVCIWLQRSLRRTHTHTEIQTV